MLSWLITSLKVVQKEKVIYICDVRPIGSFLLDKETKEACELLEEKMKPYCAVYTTYYKNIVQIHQEGATENVADSVDLVLR